MSELIPRLSYSELDPQLAELLRPKVERLKYLGESFQCTGQETIMYERDRPRAGGLLLFFSEACLRRALVLGWRWQQRGGRRDVATGGSLPGQTRCFTPPPHARRGGGGGGREA